LEDSGVDERIILKWIFRKYDGVWTGLTWLKMGMVAGSCACSSEPSGFIKCGEFLD
jgi:hypothetical protein